MSVLDDLLPGISTETLRDLLKRSEGDRPAEDLYFEFKEEWTPQHVAKTVAAFANASGGFLFLGAKAKDGRLVGLPGLPATAEYSELVSNNLVGHISPLPDWSVIVCESPENASTLVVVVRVRESRRTPHVHAKTGYIYQRSPGGTSDPIKDRASLDRLVQRGELGERLTQQRIATVLERSQLGALATDWRLSLVSVPLPPFSARLPKLMTSEGYAKAPTWFLGKVLNSARNDRIEEDAVVLSFSETCGARVFQDATMHVWWESSDNALFPVQWLEAFVTDLLRSQRRLTPTVHEVFLQVQLEATPRVQLAVNFDRAFGKVSRHPLPGRWCWQGETSTLEPGIAASLSQITKRLWRSTGKLEFDD